MARLGYSPSEKVEGGGGGRAKPGTYAFKVEEVGEKTFNSGNDGLRVVLLVDVGARDVKVFENFVYVPKALWRLEEFLAGIGLDFADPPDAHELYGKFGKAKFVVGEKGYLEVSEYIAASANNGPDSRRSAPRPALSSRGPNDDVPF